MDTTYHSNIPGETLSLLDCDVRNFDFNHPIKNIFFDNIEYIRKLDASSKARPCILDNVERSLLCHTCYLGFDQFECPDCDNWNIIPHSCHSRFCNACGVKYAKQLVVKATSFCLDYPHRHIVFTIPEELRNWFRQDRTRLNKFRYRTHLIDSFNRDPIQCKCGSIMQYTYTYNPLENSKNDRTYRKRCIDEMMRMHKRRI
ncbi:transposase zinc-binding domain-containing protein [uncultured Holdemanella sp.]|jgi:hypothetical protein|uniref:transposase zinc-binding domain-containing protein n=1 Tax=uncultured Holdemanella sp. TaxID=1763549 RepID=UPI0025F958D5|nr:transposase zinc-binding domain-containing protein [uncultured Holdemanella sp.]